MDIVRMSSITPLTFMFGVAAVMFMLGPIHVGFISDDYALIEQASQAQWLHPLERHHWAPAVGVLFKATSEGMIGRTFWWGLAFLAHCANITLVWAIVTRRLKLERLQAWSASILFTLCPAGFEALAWSCAIGYVLVTTFILLGFYFASDPDINYDKRTAGILAVLQLLALLTWDWGILFAPIMALCLASHSLETTSPSIALRKALWLLCPTIACWVIIVVAKKIIGGISIGYDIEFDIARTTFFLLSAPLRGVCPNASASFFRSMPGLGLAICLVVFLLSASLRDRQIRLLVAVFFLCQVPYALLGVPESRSFYIGIFFFYAAVVICVKHIQNPSFRLGLTVFLIFINASWAIERAYLWKGASREAEHIRVGIDNFAARMRSSQVVVVNLPDRYGPKDMKWRPYVWRNGHEAFKTQLILVNTSDATFTWAESGIPVIDRREVASRYPNVPIIEVAYKNADSWKEFILVEPMASFRSPRATDAQADLLRAYP